ncbi:hypothetical protein VNO78_28383 [Psophocarpus tetragonolobus]|uniref:C2 domain-containing protein n=1 Tax=Psophocarpus tetragonolobus TaxID=3891 RepID=A0AAN9S4E4_PSOTE
MGQSQKLTTFSCEVRIIQAQNVESTKNLFSRLYLPAGNNKRIQLSTKTVSSGSNIKHVPFWNESFSLDCSCPQEFMETLKKERLVLELRQSKIWGSSHVVAKGEIPWKAILESPNMAFKEWVKMDLVSGISECEDDMLKAPQVQVEIRIRGEKENNRRKRLNNKWDECGCKYRHHQHAWCSAEDYDIFALPAVLDSF